MKKKCKDIARNRKAFHDYFVEDKIECGLVLTGTEVCSLRENSCQLRDCYVQIRNGEAWMCNVHIAPYSHGNLNNVDPVRPRKLLLHKKQISRLKQRIAEKGYTLIPLSLYFNDKSRVKLELGVCKGKKLYDKRAVRAKRDAERAIDRALKQQRAY